MNQYKEECNCYGCTTMRHECINETYEDNKDVRQEMLDVRMNWLLTDINTTIIKEKHNEERLESIGR